MGTAAVVRYIHQPAAVHSALSGGCVALHAARARTNRAPHTTPRSALQRTGRHRHSTCPQLAERVVPTWPFRASSPTKLGRPTDIMQIWRLAAQNMPVTRLSRPLHGPESQVRTHPLPAAKHALLGRKPPLLASYAVQKPASINPEIIPCGGGCF